jgi:hypothetical protein
VNVKDRQRLKNELGKLGVPGDYLSSWPTKVDNWRHRPMRNTHGDILGPVGIAVPNQPGHPDSAVRRARHGILPTRPSESCMCKACRDRDWSTVVVDADGHIIDSEVRAGMNGSVPTVVQNENECADCGFVVPNGKDLHRSIQAHRRQRHRVAIAV